MKIFIVWKELLTLPVQTSAFHMKCWLKYCQIYFFLLYVFRGFKQPFKTRQHIGKLSKTPPQTCCCYSRSLIQLWRSARQWWKRPPWSALLRHPIRSKSPWHSWWAGHWGQADGGVCWRFGFAPLQGGLFSAPVGQTSGTCLSWQPAEPLSNTLRPRDVSVLFFFIGISS